MLDVVCGALIKDGQVMIAQRKYGSAKGKFEFPGGKVEAGETREQALIREWKEECDIDLKNVKYFRQSTDHQDGEDIVLTCFICTCDTKPTALRVHSQYIWTTPDHIYDFDFFEADRQLVIALKEEWPCLKEQMK